MVVDTADKIRLKTDKANTIMPLPELATGETGVVEDINGELPFINRASATGFNRNAEVIMLQNGKWGPVIVFIRDTQMALGRGEAAKIIIRKI